MLFFAEDTRKVRKCSLAEQRLQGWKKAASLAGNLHNLQFIVNLKLHP